MNKSTKKQELNLDVLIRDYSYSYLLNDVLNLYLTSKGLKPSTIIYFTEQFESLLKELKLPYKIESYARNTLISIGKDKSCLDNLLNAKGDAEVGRALGFPQEAISDFGKVIDGERRDGSYIEVCLAKAKQKGLELPIWLAYISHVPENMDIVNNNVSQSSKELGERYQTFVRKTKPELAEAVEAHFLMEVLPRSWELKENGTYVLHFHYGEIMPNKAE